MIERKVNDFLAFCEHSQKHSNHNDDSSPNNLQKKLLFLLKKCTFIVFIKEVTLCKANSVDMDQIHEALCVVNDLFSSPTVSQVTKCIKAM